ncbi:NAD(P)/FAD-dependent oxidoreductase [Priestia filamentosa]|uniref:NAD(P)/FAD-dependent oxidoreductase n=1 Tax=Priestia filamentosa TaxID=1402861 RepID=UPI00397DB748
MKKEIVILGAGYAGILSAINLQKRITSKEANITLVNKNDYHYFTTELHQPAAGTFPKEKTKVLITDLISPSRVNIEQDEVVEIKTKDQTVVLKNKEIKYDYLIVSLGSESETFGIPGLKEYAYGKWTYNGALSLREHIEEKFKNYNGDTKDVSIVVGGAGFTGIEFVSEIADRIPALCKQYNVPRESVKLVCVEAAPTVLPGFDEKLVNYGVKKLEKKGVQFIIGTPIKECYSNGVLLADGKEIKAETVVWAAGVRGNAVIEKSGFENTRGRVAVNKHLQAPGYNNVFIAGDCSLIMNESTQRPYPPTAQIAMQMGPLLAKNLAQMIKGNTEDLKTFKPSIKGTVASLGRKDAIGVVGNIKVYGRLASYVKKAIDLRYLLIIGGVGLALKKGRF